MKLTSHCKKAFLEYYWENYIKGIGIVGVEFETEEFFDSLYPTFQNALIIEFFDSVGIYVNAIKYLESWQPVVNIKIYNYYNTRTEATNVAIEKANTIYNEN